MIYDRLKLIVSQLLEILLFSDIRSFRVDHRSKLDHVESVYLKKEDS